MTRVSGRVREGLPCGNGTATPLQTFNCILKFRGARCLWSNDHGWLIKGHLSLHTRSHCHLSRACRSLEPEEQLWLRGGAAARVIVAGFCHHIWSFQILFAGKTSMSLVYEWLIFRKLWHFEFMGDSGVLCHIGEWSTKGAAALLHLQFHYPGRLIIALFKIQLTGCS